MLCSNLLQSFVTHMANARHLSGTMDYLLVLFLVVFLLDTCQGQIDECSSNAARVFRGERAPRGRFPYMCSLRRSASTPHLCGGVLIDSEWIMTAAHCLDLNDDSDPEIRPFVICNALQRENSVDSESFTTKKCYVHQSWNGNTFAGSDIAVCQLNERAELPIPKLARSDQAFIEANAFSVLGWGKTSFSSGPANCLQIGERLSYRSNSECNNVPIYAGLIKDTMTCAGRGLVDTCEGDSGGPLLIPHTLSNPSREDPQLDMIVGITSFGHENCQGAPGVYTRVSCFRPWVDCIVQGKGQDCNVHTPCQKGSPSCSGIPSATLNEADALNRIDKAIQSDESETVKQILCQGLSPNAVFSDNKNSLILRAAKHDSIESAKVLIEQGADIEYKNSFGQSALARAAGFGSARVAQLLIDNGANIESKNRNGWTALSYAARHNHLQVTQILIKNGANLESKSTSGLTPLYLATFYKRLAIVKELIVSGANVDNKSNNGFSPLNAVTQVNSIEIAKELISSGADINSQTKKGFTPLHSAAQNNSIEIAKELIAAGADLSSRTNKGFTPLHIAAQYNSVEIAKEFLSNNADIEARINTGGTPLHIASYHGSFDVVQMLLDEEAVVESVNNKKQTSLHYASSRGHVSVVRVLLLNGASKRSTDADGNTPLDVICTNKFLDEPCQDNVIKAIRRLLES